MGQHNKVVIFDSPDGTGKTEISQTLSRELGIPYFKMNTEHQNWRKGRFKDALEFDQPYLLQFLKQTDYDVIIDRAYPAEWVYSRAYNRTTNDSLLEELDKGHATLGTIIVIPLRRNYANNREDELVAKKDLPYLHAMYRAFAEWTQCQTITIYVDDFANDLERQLPHLHQALHTMWKCPQIRHMTLGVANYEKDSH